MAQRAGRDRVGPGALVRVPLALGLGVGLREEDLEPVVLTRVSCRRWTSRRARYSRPGGVRAAEPSRGCFYTTSVCVGSIPGRLLRQQKTGDLRRSRVPGPGQDRSSPRLPLTQRTSAPLSPPPREGSRPAGPAGLLLQPLFSLGSIPGIPGITPRPRRGAAFWWGREGGGPGADPGPTLYAPSCRRQARPGQARRERGLNYTDLRRSLQPGEVAPPEDLYSQLYSQL